MIRMTPAIIATCLVVSGCSPPPIDIALANSNGQPTIRFSQNWGILFFSRNRVPCIGKIEIFEQEVDGSLVWEIEAVDDHQCLHLETLNVGQVPPGWKAVAALARPLRGQHSVVVRGIGDGDAMLEF